jgi:integrase
MAVVRLLILTACRRDEIGRLSWSEVDLDRGQITIAASRSKNHRAHTMSLPPAALDLLRTVPRRSDTDFVFGGETGFSSWSHRMMRPGSSSAQASQINLISMATKRDRATEAPQPDCWC